MRVLVAGATGVIGAPLVELLVAGGHEGTGTTRSAAKAGSLRAAGATPIVVDVFDRETLVRSVITAKPEIVIHQLTDLPDQVDPAQMVAMTERNARMRGEGTRNPVAAPRSAGARRLVAQSIAWAYAPGSEPHGED